MLSALFKWLAVVGVVAALSVGGAQAAGVDAAGDGETFPAMAAVLLFGLGLIAMGFACFWRSPASMVIHRTARLSADNRQSRGRPR